MVDWEKNKYWIFNDGQRIAIIIGEQHDTKVVGKFRGQLWNDKVVHLNLKDTMMSHDMRLYSGTDGEGNYKDTGRKVVMVNYFLDGKLGRNAITPAYVENEQLRSQLEGFRRLNIFFKERLYSLTGKDWFDEAMLREAKKSSNVRREYYRNEDYGGFGGGSLGFRGGGGGYSNYPNYNRHQNQSYSTPTTEE